MINLLLWLVPAFVVPVSYLFYRYLPFRKVRYLIYSLLLIAAFFLNLFQISFWNELFDTVEFILINFIVAEFIWNLLKIKRPKIFIVLFLIALCLYGFELKRWMIAGPDHAAILWKPLTASTYRRDAVDYAVREYELFKRGHQVSVLVLSKRTGALLFEKQIGSYRTPEGFGDAEFSYQWSRTDQGIRLDLYAAGYRLWTMGEGF